jgi:FAD/FMN-containing dehydrogenase
MPSSHATPSAILSAAQKLRATMKGNVLLADDDGYAQVRAIWNGAVEHRPAIIASCKSSDDVRAGLRVAQEYGIHLSVLGGGHDWAGRGLRHGGLVLDLSPMRHVAIDPAARVATVAGGATAADVMTAAAPYGLAGVTANVGAVGMAGFALAGGYGPLTTRYGLAIDNLLGIEIVLPDGSIVLADESSNDDLFWALRGGGGNFGVVTSMRFRLHPVTELLAGIILFPWSEASSALKNYNDILASAPDELSLLCGCVPGPDGTPLLFVGPVWSGDIQHGEEAIKAVEAIGTPVHTQVGPMSYSAILGMYDAQVVKGNHYAVETRWLPELGPDAISALISAGSKRTSALSFMALHHFHGAGLNVAPDATAFNLRERHFMVEIVAAWVPGTDEESAAHRKWVSDASALLAPHALPGQYPNFLLQDSHKEARFAYGNNSDRLCRIKRKYDPQNIFSSATPMPR